MNTKNSNPNRRVLKRYTAEDRVKYVEEYNKSGLRPSAFCHKKGINPTTFRGWVKKSTANKTKFIEVSLPATTPITTKPVIEVKLSNGAQINIPVALDAERIADLVRRITTC